MNVLVYLVPMALLLGLTGLAAFMWSLSSGQYDDVEGAALRILDNDDIEASSESRAKRSFVRNAESVGLDRGS
jgi:cbb3-type cytochrome oxidase maturation protein